jgi:GTP cyclohydrolase I
MNKPVSAATEIPDTQNSLDTRHIAIDKVGIKDIKHPIVVSDRSGREQHTVANFNMYVNLPEEYKGTHMKLPCNPLNA